MAVVKTEAGRESRDNQAAAADSIWSKLQLTRQHEQPRPGWQQPWSFCCAQTALGTHWADGGRCWQAQAAASSSQLDCWWQSTACFITAHLPMHTLCMTERPALPASGRRHSVTQRLAVRSTLASTSPLEQPGRPVLQAPFSPAWAQQVCSLQAFPGTTACRQATLIPDNEAKLKPVGRPYRLPADLAPCRDTSVSPGWLSISPACHASPRLP